MRARVALVLLGACGGPPPAAPVAPLGNAAAPPIATGVPAIDVTTLRTPDDLRRVPRAAHLRATAQLRWRQAPPGEGDVLSDASSMTGGVWPVLDETPTDVRIAVDRGGAVIAVWLARDGLVPAIIDEVTPSRGGAALPVTLRPGAALAVEGDGAIALVHAAIDLRADVPAAAIGNVFTIAAVPPSAAVTGSINPGTDVRATADPAAPPFAHLHDVVVVAFGETRGGLRAFTYVDAYVSMLGYVPVGATTDQTVRSGWGTGPDYDGGFPDRLIVPDGTCLLSSDGEEVVGITNGLGTWRARAGATARYWELHLMVPWGTAHPLIEDLDATGDVATVRPRSCAR